MELNKKDTVRNHGRVFLFLCLQDQPCGSAGVLVLLSLSVKG